MTFSKGSLSDESARNRFSFGKDHSLVHKPIVLLLSFIGHSSVSVLLNSVAIFHGGNKRISFVR